MFTLETTTRCPWRQNETCRIDSQRVGNFYNVPTFVSQTSSDAKKFTMVFEMENETQEARVYRPNTSDLSSSLGQIARYVAATGQILNIGDVATWLKKDVMESGRKPIRSILCMPIVNGQRIVIGVAQLINKVRTCHYRLSTCRVRPSTLIFFRFTFVKNWLSWGNSEWIKWEWNRDWEEWNFGFWESSLVEKFGFLRQKRVWFIHRRINPIDLFVLVLNYINTLLEHAKEMYCSFTLYEYLRVLKLICRNTFHFTKSKLYFTKINFISLLQINSQVLSLGVGFY